MKKSYSGSFAQEKLEVFQTPKRAEGPDYASKGVVEEVERQFGIKRPF